MVGQKGDQLGTRAILGAIGLFGLISLALCWIAGSLLVRGSVSPVRAAAPPARDLFLETADGVRIAATYRPGRTGASPAILLLHGVGASREATAANAAWLSQRGYATLAIDFRGHGGSTVAARSFGLREAADARVALDWLKHAQKGAPVAIIGISLGGAATLLGAQGPVPADALILQAVYPDIRHAIRNRLAERLTAGPAWLLEPLLSYQSLPRYGVWPSRLSPRDALKQYRGPVFVIGGEEDRSTPPDESRHMAAAASGLRALWLVPHGDHAAICNLRDLDYRGHVGDFLRRTIGPA